MRTRRRGERRRGGATIRLDVGDGSTTTVSLPRALVLSAASPTGDADGAPPPAPARPRPDRAARRRAAAWVALLMAAVLVPVDLAAWQVLRAAVDGRVDRLLGSEITEFREFAASAADPAAGRDFADVDALLQAHLDRQRPGPHEVVFGHVDGDPGGLVSAERAAREEILASTGAQGETPTPEGLLRWEKARVHLPGGAAGEGPRGWFVTGYLVDADMARADRTAGVIALVSLGALAAAGALGWGAAGWAAQAEGRARAVAVPRPPGRRSGTPTTGRRDGADDDEEKPESGSGTGNSGDASAEEVGGDVPEDTARLGERFAALATRLAEAQAALDDASAQEGAEGAPEGGPGAGRAAPAGEGVAPGADGGGVSAGEGATGGRRIRSAAAELDRMARIAEDLRLLAEAERPGFVRPVKVAMAELTVDVDARLRTRTDREWRLDEIADGTAYLDPHRVTQAMERLARNAVQHTAPGATIHTGSAFSADGRTVSLWVADSGPGIAERDQRRVFAPFAVAGASLGGDGDPLAPGGRGGGADGEARPDHPGAGLGLAVVRAVAEAHGGTVVLRSAPGEGAVFRLVLPLDAREPQDAREKRQG
ncbi:HAMP domain-containing histidine kinase [Streptomonospora sp. S1-112]|uniref:histidine kinase n=1 Tax=Streptomonospora mangrovi TaxID=2883123 RepID=A0A9X3NIB5_9ACTN|nr:HAMP domain-containing sensor histidine kinase [Streptomonospora mangrovi]MDA0564217.1 HAMP domain-containing histidine kinase [Streptomonospora mangrovi]